MSTVWEEIFPFLRKGPITRRAKAPNNLFPNLSNVFAGKDSEGFIQKSLVMSRYTVLTAGFFSMADIVLMPRKNPSLALSVSRIKFWTVPIVGGGLTYTAVVNMVSGIRGGKSDQWNHFFAGVSVGALVGKHAQCTVTGFVTAAILGLAGVICKDSDIYGIDLFFTTRGELPQQGNSMYHKYDFTLKPYRQGYWVRKEEDIPEMQKRGVL